MLAMNIIAIIMVCYLVSDYEIKDLLNLKKGKNDVRNINL